MVASSPVFWFYVFWGPKFLSERFHLDLRASSIPLVVIFLGAGFGGVAGGWIASALLRRGWSVNAARKTTMLVCALAAAPVFSAALAPNVWIAVLLIALAAGGHCGFVANLYSLTSDLFPGPLVGTVTGIGGMASSLAAVFFAEAVGRVLNANAANYLPLFAACSASYVIGIGIMHLLSPRLAPSQLG